MDKINKLILLFLLMGIYVLLINQMPSLLSKLIVEPYYKNQSQQNQGFISHLSFSDSVSVSITRPRFYGEIHESPNYKDINLFKIVKLPLQYYDINFIYFHLLFIAGVTYFMVKGGQNESKRQELF